MKKLTLALLFALILAGGIAMFLGNTDVSLSERRQMAQWSDVAGSNLLSGNFMTKVENAAMDQFPLRDSFRSLKANFLYRVMGKLDNNNLYIHNGSAAKLEYPLDEVSVQNAISKFSKVQNSFLRNPKINIYTCIVPDKGYYLAQELGYPTLDYERMEQMFSEGLRGTNIRIYDLLNIDSYYATDPHWTQGELVPVAQYLAEQMGVPFNLDGATLHADGEFVGAYVGQSAMNLAKDELTYWDGGILENLKATDLSTGESIPVYNLEGRQGNDPYDFFLGGAAPLQVIENPDCPNNRELIIFRDSFGSSIAPLLAGSYSRVILVDLRYMSSNILNQYIRFSNQDVLFLYSTLILNQSSALR